MLQKFLKNTPASIAKIRRFEQPFWPAEAHAVAKVHSPFGALQAHFGVWINSCSAVVFEEILKKTTSLRNELEVD